MKTPVEALNPLFAESPGDGVGVTTEKVYLSAEDAGQTPMVQATLPVGARGSSLLRANDCWQRTRAGGAATSSRCSREFTRCWTRTRKNDLPLSSGAR